ncbi:MAG: hypothetical protein A2339_00855 [Elusimicrobia bacterium RIFOXYB12_FULL_50_12]|nr:MAG: hypothetical protein A2278_05220 [Elusimicrobia bacterium RIFOXYA12_FULL_49_49]OGS15231.1 MAG: hypothetical protein A2251_06950 [Elusimicrobia bacterium RIFOXYA2_FULL_47_53]OGS25914.1 MAG: hypothetical protein A2339_00855 [Elusimicrobia bacterium RIFOXYB12_FULL_50_12]OGS30282.1 MAG: hypothetical protein A2323_05525 [Elusimicrobia bacterium RIFOXYB2_FULL_46_23]
MYLSRTIFGDEMRLHQHIIASVAFSGGIYGITGSKSIALASFVTGVLLDLDHVTDYWLEHPLSLNVPHFFEMVDACKLRKTHLWLHSLEMLIPLAVAVWLSKSAILLGISIGFAQHMLFDCLFNFIYPGSYFLAYRIQKGFKSECVFVLPEGYHETEKDIK